jgi:hypothetical protein
VTRANSCSSFNGFSAFSFQRRKAVANNALQWSADAIADKRFAQETAATFLSTCKPTLLP